LDPHHAAFDPLKGASLLMRRGEPDEAVWLTFVATHFGKHKDDGWKLAANVFGSFGAGPIWTAKAYRRAPNEFLAMLISQRDALSDMKRSGRYSNHRQYQSKAPEAIDRTFRSFCDWQFVRGGFPQLVRATHETYGQKTHKDKARKEPRNKARAKGAKEKKCYLSVLGHFMNVSVPQTVPQIFEEIKPPVSH
jgi:hypothetical protein